MREAAMLNAAIERHWGVVREIAAGIAAEQRVAAADRDALLAEISAVMRRPKEAGAAATAQAAIQTAAVVQPAAAMQPKTVRPVFGDDVDASPVSTNAPAPASVAQSAGKQPVTGAAGRPLTGSRIVFVGSKPGPVPAAVALSGPVPGPGPRYGFASGAVGDGDDDSAEATWMDMGGVASGR